MIENVRVINDNLVDVTIPVTDKFNSVQIVDIKGLGPVKAEINAAKRGQGVGSAFSSSRLGNRNLVFSIQLHKRDMEGTRRQVYLYFPVGERVQMRFKSGDQLYQIYGYVESVEPEIFTKYPSMQVSVICTDPLFKMYPSNNSVLLAENEQGSMISYQGRVNSGVNIEIHIKPWLMQPDLSGRITVSQWEGSTLTRELSFEDFDILRLTGGKTRFGDVIKISTVEGKKTATLTRDGKTYNIMPAIKNNQGYFLAQNQWPLLRVRRYPYFRYSSNRWELSQLAVTIKWDDLVEGL